jgi:hypothetical protein
VKRTKPVRSMEVLGVASFSKAFGPKFQLLGLRFHSYEITKPLQRDALIVIAVVPHQGFVRLALKPGYE